MSLLHQRGVALIMVLGVLAVISVLAGAIYQQTRTDQQLSSQYQALQQGYWYALGGEQVALGLADDYLEKQRLKEQESEIVFPVSEGTIQLTLIPRQQCFNLNALSDEAVDYLPDVQTSGSENTDQGSNDNDSAAEGSGNTEGEQPLTGLALKRNQLLRLFELVEIDSARASQFIDRLSDWLDADSLPEGSYGAEDVEYSGQQLPQLPANQHLISDSEWLEFIELSQQERQNLEQLLCLRPGDNALRINPNQLTESQAVLVAAVLGSKVSEQLAADLFAQKPSFETLDGLWQSSELSGIQLESARKADFSIEHRFAEVKTEVDYAAARFTLNSLIVVDKANRAQVLARRYGVSH